MKKEKQGPRTTSTPDPDPQLIEWENSVCNNMKDRNENVRSYWGEVEPKIKRIEILEINEAEAAAKKYLKIVVKNIHDPKIVTFGHTMLKRQFPGKPNVLDDVLRYPPTNYEISDRNPVRLTRELAARYKTVSFVCPLEALPRQPITRVYFYSLSKVGLFTAIDFDFWGWEFQHGSATRGVKIPSSSIIE